MEAIPYDLSARRREIRSKFEPWKGTFGEYFQMAARDPSIARLSHARIYDMIMAPGVKEPSKDGEKGEKSYNFFNRELFGIEDPIQQTVEFFGSAAKRLETRKRILLLMGPPGGGKSTFVTMLKGGLEEYTKSNEGALYAIAGCPMHEEPLHLVEDELRPEIKRDLGLYIEGDLCPTCRIAVKEYKGDIDAVPVHRIFLSEKERLGIGTFSPSDPKSQDISELVGSIDLATVGEYGAESDPRAYRFDGELNISNRGAMEFIEMLKADEKFLYHLLTLSQEQMIKTGRFALIYADEVIVSHSNETEYNNFKANRKNEALRDRLKVIRFPYNLKVTDETRIYKKLMIEQSNLLNTHFAPEALKTAAVFSVLSRLEAPPEKTGGTKLTLIQKLKLYDGETVSGQGETEVRELKEKAPNEGMKGISPRFTINALSQAAAGEEVKCINALDVLRALANTITVDPGFTQEEKKSFRSLIAEARKDYDERIKPEITKAFVYAFKESAQGMLDNYLDNVDAFCNKKKLRDPITDEEKEPDEKLMRSIEEQIGIAETAKAAFRGEILIRISSLARKGQKFEYDSHERLKEAIEKKLFADIKETVRMTTSTKTPDTTQLERISNVVKVLINEQGYCTLCADETLKYVGELLNR